MFATARSQPHPPPPPPPPTLPLYHRLLTRFRLRFWFSHNALVRKECLYLCCALRFANSVSSLNVSTPASSSCGTPFCWSRVGSGEGVGNEKGALVYTASEISAELQKYLLHTTGSFLFTDLSFKAKVVSFWGMKLWQWIGARCNSHLTVLISFSLYFGCSLPCTFPASFLAPTTPAPPFSQPPPSPHPNRSHCLILNINVPFTSTALPLIPATINISWDLTFSSSHTFFFSSCGGSCEFSQRHCLPQNVSCFSTSVWRWFRSSLWSAVDVLRRFYPPFVVFFATDVVHFFALPRCPCGAPPKLPRGCCGRGVHGCGWAAGLTHSVPQTHQAQCLAQDEMFAGIDCSVFSHPKPMTMALSVLVVIEMLNALNRWGCPLGFLERSKHALSL